MFAFLSVLRILVPAVIVFLLVAAATVVLIGTTVIFFFIILGKTRSISGLYTLVTSLSLPHLRRRPS